MDRVKTLSNLRRSQSEQDCSPNHFSCHQLILSALQGVCLSAEDRTKVANSISDMIINQKSMIVEFVKNEIIPHAMENNACKALACTKKELSRPISDDRIERLSKLWNNFYTFILPNIQSMLYPLEAYYLPTSAIETILQQFERSFNCRKFVLTAFRDRALIPIMRDWLSTDNRLIQMLVVVAIGTNDRSVQYDRFLTICSNCLPGYIADRQEEVPRMTSETREGRSSTELQAPDQTNGRMRPTLSTAISVPDGLRHEGALGVSPRNHKVHWKDLNLPPIHRKEALSARQLSNTTSKEHRKKKLGTVAVSFEI